MPSSRCSRLRQAAGSTRPSVSAREPSSRVPSGLSCCVPRYAAHSICVYRLLGGAGATQPPSGPLPAYSGKSLGERRGGVKIGDCLGNCARFLGIFVSEDDANRPRNRRAGISQLPYDTAAGTRLRWAEGGGLPAVGRMAGIGANSPPRRAYRRSATHLRPPPSRCRTAKRERAFAAGLTKPTVTPLPRLPALRSITPRRGSRGA